MDNATLDRSWRDFSARDKRRRQSFKNFQSKIRQDSVELMDDRWVAEATTHLITEGHDGDWAIEYVRRRVDELKAREQRKIERSQKFANDQDIEPGGAWVDAEVACGYFLASWDHY